MIFLKTVDTHSRSDIEILYKLLAERTPNQAISHKVMPTYRQHSMFVKSCPYRAWYLIGVDTYGVPKEFVGATYLTHANELGIFIFRKHTGNGYGLQAITEMVGLFDPPFYANINPENWGSICFFRELGFKPLQTTYVLEDK